MIMGPMGDLPLWTVVTSGLTWIIPPKCGIILRLFINYSCWYIKIHVLCQENKNIKEYITESKFFMKLLDQVREVIREGVIIQRFEKFGIFTYIKSDNIAIPPPSLDRGEIQIFYRPLY